MNIKKNISGKIILGDNIKSGTVFFEDTIKDVQKQLKDQGQQKGQQQEETSRVATEPVDRNWQARQQAYTELASELSGLVVVFSRLPGQPDNGFQPSVDQALFLLNSEQMVKFMKDSQLLERLLRLEEKPGELVAELYLSVLSRAPVDEEQAEVAKLFAAAADRDQRREVIRRITWGLLVSAEFRLNH